MKKVAIGHDCLSPYSGSEKLSVNILKIYPTSEIYMLFDFMPEHDRTFLNRYNIQIFSPVMVAEIETLSSHYQPLLECESA